MNTLIWLLAFVVILILSVIKSFMCFSVSVHSLRSAGYSECITVHEWLNSFYSADLLDLFLSEHVNVHLFLSTLYNSPICFCHYVKASKQMSASLLINIKKANVWKHGNLILFLSDSPDHTLLVHHPCCFYWSSGNFVHCSTGITCTNFHVVDFVNKPAFCYVSGSNAD